MTPLFSKKHLAPQGAAPNEAYYVTLRILLYRLHPSSARSSGSVFPERHGPAVHLEFWQCFPRRRMSQRKRGTSATPRRTPVIFMQWQAHHGGTR